MPDTSQNQDLLELAFDLSPAGMLVVDGTGSIRLVNRELERLFGYSREELLGQSVELLLPGRLQPAHPTQRAGYLAHPERRSMGAGRDLKGRRKDGTEVAVEIGLNPIRTDEGMLVLGTVVDITERRMIESQLRQAQKMEAVGTLAGGIAHDFNNLLHGIVGHAELVLRDAAPESGSRADVEQILKIAERGRHLVDRILTFSRQREVSRVVIPLERPIHEAVELLRASLPREIEIREHLDPATPQVRCDETQIHQIAVNLGTNAAHAMEQGGVLEVRLAPFEATVAHAGSHPWLKVGPHAHLRVVDSGTGIPPEVLERVLEPFFTTKAPGKGTGLGLSMIHGIVKSLDGAIEIASRVGEGTRVDIFLPAASAESHGAHAQVADAPAVDPRAGWPHVLVVEDEQDFAGMLRRQLEAFEYRATVHISSIEALEDFKARPDAFDVLMTDNSMPRMSGLKLIEEVRKVRPSLPVLLVSGTAAHVDPAGLKALGITHTLRKPHSGREMDAALRAALKPG